MDTDIKSLRVVHFAKYFPPNWGGVETVTDTIARGTSDYGLDVSVVCFDKKSNETIENGVRIVRCKELLKPASQPLGIKYFGTCLKLGRRADIIHLHAPNMLAALAAVLLPRKTHIVLHWHSDVVGKGMIAKLTRPLERSMIAVSTRIICTSQKYADSSKPLSKVRDKIRVVPIGILDHTDARLEDTDVPMILSIGRLVPYKGFEVLVAACKNIHASAKCLIVGDGPLRGDLQNQITAAGMQGRVCLLGQVDDTELAKLLKSATLYCMPSIERSEAFGVVLLEAMSHGIPVVATNIPGSGVPWVNAHGVSGINVTPNDPEALAEACNSILRDPQLREKYSQGARRRYEQNFTEEAFITGILDVYAETMHCTKRLTKHSSGSA